jgi:predicted  nucleic acid-binding Zn-ribbon protein
MRNTNNTNGKRQQELNDLRRQVSSHQLNISHLEELIPILEDLMSREDMRPEVRAKIENTLTSRKNGLERARRELNICEQEIETMQNELRGEDAGKSQGLNSSGRS